MFWLLFSFMSIYSCCLFCWFLWHGSDVITYWISPGFVLISWMHLYLIQWSKLACKQSNWRVVYSHWNLIKRVNPDILDIYCMLQDHNLELPLYGKVKPDAWGFFRPTVSLGQALVGGQGSEAFRKQGLTIGDVMAKSASTLITFKNLLQNQFKGHILFQGEITPK